MLTRLTLFLLATALAAPGFGADIKPGPWPPRLYACQRASHAPTIDGRLDEAAWAAAPWTTEFVDIEGVQQPRPRLKTRAKMLWDDTCFYVAAELVEPDLWATLRERDSIIFHDNDFEVFIDPDGDSHLYTEIELNAFNTVWDLLLVKPYRNGGPALHDWNIPGLLTAVSLEGTINDATDTDGGWTVELAIPFAALAPTTEADCPPAPGQRWRVNFSRVEWHLDQSGDRYSKRRDAETGQPLPEDNWVWSPQRLIAMHEPEHWGLVEFVVDPPAQSPAVSAVEAAEWFLRRAAYELAAYREENGVYPTTFAPPGTVPGGPRRAEQWAWPPRYWSDGSAYTLTLDLGREFLRLTDDGRLQRRPKE